MGMRNEFICVRTHGPCWHAVVSCGNCGLTIALSKSCTISNTAKQWNGVMCFRCKFGAKSSWNT